MQDIFQAWSDGSDSAVHEFFFADKQKNDSTSQQSYEVSLNKPTAQSSCKNPLKCSISATLWLITAAPAVRSALLDEKACC